MNEGSNSDHEESEAIEEERSGKAEDRFELAEVQPPDAGCNGVDCRDDIECGGRLANFSSQEGDLVGISCDDLAESKEEGVDRPIADLLHHESLQASRRHVILTK